MGAATETITVEADSVRVQTEHGEVSSVITGQQITQLATNGRSMYSLANLTPGASSGQADFQVPTPVGGDAAMSFNGQRQSHNLYMLDGAESSDRGGGGGSDVMPSLDAIGEFRMLTLELQRRIRPVFCRDHDGSHPLGREKLPRFGLGVRAQ